MADMSRFKKAREELEYELRKKYLPENVNLMTAQDVFDLAWEYGHANGIEEVKIYYQDLAILVKDALIRKGF